MNTAKEKISSLKSSLLSISTKYVTTMIDDVDQRQKSRIENVATFLYILYLSLLCLRVVVIALIYNWHLFPEDYFTYDLFGGFLGPSRMNLLDGNLCLVLWPALVIITFLHCTVTPFYRRLQLTSFAFQLIVTNRECFWPLNPQLTLKVLIKVLWKKDRNELSRIKFSRRTLSHFPHLPHLVRCQAVLLSQVLDILIACFVVEFALFCLFGVFYYYVFLLWPFYSFAKCLLIIFEVSMVFYAVWHSTNIFLFLVHVFNLVLFALIAQQRAINSKLKKRISLVTKTTKKLSSSKLAALLNQYNSCHFQFIRTLLITNREYISTFLWLFFWTMFPLNTYSLATVTLKSVPLSVKMLLLVNSSLQIGNATLAIFPMLKAVSPINSASRYFHWAQPHLNVSQINLKVKLLTYYDVLTTGEKIAYTVGVFGHVTPKALFEVLVVQS